MNAIFIQVRNLCIRITKKTKASRSFFLLALISLLSIQPALSENEINWNQYNVPDGYLEEAKDIPSFWVTTTDQINDFLGNRVKKGRVVQIGTSAGGRPIKAVIYGTTRKQGGTTTFSGALSLTGKTALGPRWLDAYRGCEANKKVFATLGGVHGFELEGIMGAINLLSVLETGRDLNDEVWPQISKFVAEIDCIIVVPLVNPDGRARVPLRMESYKGGERDSHIVHQYLNTGGRKDGTLIGWPAVKEYIPMRFGDFAFPGGYPNDAGVNLMHDDFLGHPQPETRALFDLFEREKPDLILNMHTGVGYNNYYMTIHRPFTEPVLQPVFDTLYRRIKTGLVREDLQGSKDMERETNPSRVAQAPYNLSTALNLHCGALSVVIESPSHGYSGKNRAGQPAIHPPARLLRAQLVAYEEALGFLSENGGRTQWKITKDK